MKNITTIDEVNVQYNVAIILLFLLMALVSYNVEYKKALTMRVVNAVIISFSLIPYIMIAKITGGGTNILFMLLVGVMSSTILFSKSSQTKHAFKYCTILLFSILFIYSVWSALKFV